MSPEANSELSLSKEGWEEILQGEWGREARKERTAVQSVPLHPAEIPGRPWRIHLRAVSPKRQRNWGTASPTTFSHYLMAVPQRFWPACRHGARKKPGTWSSHPRVLRNDQCQKDMGGVPWQVLKWDSENGPPPACCTLFLAAYLAPDCMSSPDLHTLYLAGLTPLQQWRRLQPGVYTEFSGGELGNTLVTGPTFSPQFSFGQHQEAPLPQVTSM